MNRVFGVLLILLALGFLGVIPVLFILPETFASTVRVRIPAAGPQGNAADSQSQATEMELLRSQATLEKVVTHLGLPKKWAERYKKKNELPLDACAVILKSMIRVQTVDNTELLAVTATSGDKYEAAEIANEVVQARIAAAGDTNSPMARAGGRLEIVERAEPTLRPVRSLPRLAFACGFTALAFLGAGVPLLLRKSARGQ